MLPLRASLRGSRSQESRSFFAWRWPLTGQSKRNHLKWLFMRQIFAIAFVAFSAAAIASGQKQGAIRDPKRIVEQVIRKLDKERIQAQIHADAAALERIYADDFIGVDGAHKRARRVMSHLARVVGTDSV
jgi:hypothetical protein